MIVQEAPRWRLDQRQLAVVVRADAGAGSGEPATADGRQRRRGGSSPDEAIADAAEQPHAVSTPDDPAETVTIDEDAAKKA